ncbi:MAG: rod-binding protein [Thermodesulfobacteriota bacterium]|nr:rod-binding protein [Thermodesulfobacteriota bacterium]
MIPEISSLFHLRSSNPEEALKKTCKAFESIFTHQLLKTMGNSMPEGFINTGLSGEIYKDMLYMAVARSASKGKGLGIAETLYSQMRSCVDHKI